MRTQGADGVFMKHFAKSILNYFATFNETRFRFGTKKLAYQWADHQQYALDILDLAVFPDVRFTTFKTTITDTNEQAFAGLDGLAMILVDTDYDGETFKVDSCFYQKDLKEGEVALKGANSKTALIAVDKHGNESQIVTVKG
jgi:hypothetical protein